VSTVLYLAHTGHALVDLVIFVGPVVLLLGWVYIANRREARRGQGAPDEPRK
jgi:hypothetical protein